MSTSRSLWLACVLLAVPGAGFAHSVSEEVAVGSTTPTPQSPRSGSLSNLLTGVADFSDAFSLRLDVALTHDNPVGGQTGGGNVAAFTLGADWIPSDNWSFGLGLDASPRSTTTSQTTVQFEESATGQTSEANARLATTTSSSGLTVLGGFTTGGDSDFESGLDGTLSFTRYSTIQRVTDIETATGRVVSAQTVAAYCNRAITRAAKAACAPLLAAIQAQPASLSQLRFGLSFTETLFSDTDLSLTASGYLYDRDPTQVGYFSLLTVGRTVAVGNGFPLAPLQYSVRPGIMHRFGNFWLDGSYQFGRYVDDEGVTHAVTIRAQYRFSKAFRLWARLSVQLDVNADNQPSRANSIAAGARFTF